MSHATLNQFKTSLGVNTTTNDAYFQEILNRASDLIDNQIIGRRVAEATYSEFVDGDGTRFLNLREGPIVSIASIALVTYTTDGTVTISDTLSAGDYFARGLRSDAWRLPGYVQTNGAWSWVEGDQNYQVTYDAGFTTGSIPDDIVNATIYAATWLKNKRTDAGTGSRDVGQGSRSFRAEPDLLEDLRSLLASYVDEGGS